MRQIIIVAALKVWWFFAADYQTWELYDEDGCVFGWLRVIDRAGCGYALKRWDGSLMLLPTEVADSLICMCGVVTVG